MENARRPEPSFSDHQALIGVRATERLRRKARLLAGRRVLHVNSTRQGGGVAEILSSLVPLMNEVGVEADWLVIEGTPEFFTFTKALHNALQGERLQLGQEGMLLHREVACANAGRAQLGSYDLVIVHDPQPLPLVELRRGERWVWWCHIDVSQPDPTAWAYMAPTVSEYDAAVFSLPEYAQVLAAPQRFIMPAIDPFSLINRELSRTETGVHLARYGIPTDLPLVVQVGRFDKWKDPQGVIEAYCAATARRPATLVLVGNTAADDPEGQEMYESVCAFSCERILVIGADDPLLVNALQRRAAVVLQKSLREGFGLTVSEAMWKGRAVIGGNVGGIRHQIVHDHTGFLAEDVEEAARHIADLLAQPDLRRTVGRRARERVRRRFLMTRLLEDWLDLMRELLADQPRRASAPPLARAS